jgi:flagellar biosynthesis protein FlhG
MRKLSSGKRTFSISVTSGKGGVGKTLTTVNIAAHLRRMGRSVLILDGDMGLANCDVVMGMTSRYNIRDVLDGHVDLKDIVITTPHGVDLIPSGSGIRELANLSPAQRSVISSQLSQLEGRYDILLIDTGAGIGDLVLHLNASADKTLVVTTPEPHALTDAYALIKVMSEESGRNSFDLLVNQVRSEGEGLKVFERIAEVAVRFLKARVSYAGAVPQDPQVARTVMSRRAATEQSTSTISGQAWAQVARRLVDPSEAVTRSSGGFWGQFVQVAGL